MENIETFANYLKIGGGFLLNQLRKRHRLLKGSGVHRLIQAYHDLESILKKLQGELGQTHVPADRKIDLKKLIVQLSMSKKKLERKIGNTILLEKQRLEKNLKSVLREGHL